MMRNESSRPGSYGSCELLLGRGFALGCPFHRGRGNDLAVGPRRPAAGTVDDLIGGRTRRAATRPLWVEPPADGPDDFPPPGRPPLPAAHPAGTPRPSPRPPRGP